MRTAFDDAARSLVTAIGAHTDASVTLGPPREDGAGPGVDVHLLRVHLGPRERHTGVQRMPVELDHLVAVNGAGDEVAGLLHDVLVAVEATTDHRVVDDQIDDSFWLACGRSPRPALRVLTAVHVDRAIGEAPIVTEQLIVDSRIHRANHHTNHHANHDTNHDTNPQAHDHDNQHELTARKA